MTASRHGDNQICSFSRVSFLSESPTPNGLPKHSFIMAYRTIGLRVDVFQCHTSSYGKLDHMGKAIHSFFDITYGTLRNCFPYPATSKLIGDRVQSTWTQYSVPSVPEKSTEDHSRIWHLPALTRIAAHDVIKPVTAYQPAKLVMRKILVALSFGNAHNMALESPRLSYHLLQSMNNQIDPLLLENPALFA